MASALTKADQKFIDAKLVELRAKKITKGAKLADYLDAIARELSTPAAAKEFMTSIAGQVMQGKR